MIKNILGTLLMAACIVGGAFAANMLKPNAGPVVIAESVATARAAEAEAEEEARSQAKDQPGHDDHSARAASSGGHGAAPKPGSRSYYKFSRQFLVPVVGAGDVQSLVIIDLNLEVEPHMTETIFSMEPKIRDALMTELMKLSNEGRFQSRLTDPENYAELRSRMLGAVHRVLHDGVYDVLILDIARQDK